MDNRYDFPVDPSNKKTVYARIIEWTGTGKRVLDIGCDTGNLGGYLKGMGNRVDGVELDAGTAEAARARLDKVYVGGIDDEATLAGIEGGYDTIIFADVLEHLAEPGETLRRVSRLLSPGGEVIASIPNVANFRVRFGLLFGMFNYTDKGILDRTHLRFYTRNTAVGLLVSAGYDVIDVRPAATYMPGILLGAWPCLFATRFVIKARVQDTA